MSAGALLLCAALVPMCFTLTLAHAAHAGWLHPTRQRDSSGPGPTHPERLT